MSAIIVNHSFYKKNGKEKVTKCLLLLQKDQNLQMFYKVTCRKKWTKLQPCIIMQVGFDNHALYVFLKWVLA